MDGLTREERRQKAALTEARKAGKIPLELDKDGNMINPHIPEFMSKAPWYMNQEEGDGLKHQKLADDKKSSKDLEKWYKRGEDALDLLTRKRKFEKGACKNCGARTHDAKNCMERPRKIGAWKTNSDLAPDEIVQEKMELSYDAARDRWNGYDVSEHAKTVKLFNKAEEEKRKQVLRERDERLRKKKERKAQRAEERRAAGEEEDDSSSDSESDNDDVLGVKQDESAEQVFKVGNKVKATVPNLRIREDTVKYLRNLDINSAYYDPKTRSMRANPNPDQDANEADYVGDNYVKATGDAVEMAKAQVFAWEAHRRGETEGHLQANPTQVLLARKQHEERLQKMKESRKKRYA